MIGEGKKEKFVVRPRFVDGSETAYSSPVTLEESSSVGWIGSPVDGLRKSLFDLGPCVKLNMLRSEPAPASKDWFPIRPVCQLFSMNAKMDAWSVTVWSTKFGFAHSEITRRGCRGP